MSLPFHYRVDAAGRIAFVSPAWREFARANDAADLADDGVLGHRLEDYVAGAETRYLYSLLFDRVRDEGREFRLPFRCDSPRLRRFMELRMAPGLRGAVDCAGRLLRSEERAAVNLLDVGVARCRDTVRICSFCKKLEYRDGAWAEVEQGIEALQLFDAPELPSLSHVVCPECLEMAHLTMNGRSA